MRLLILATFVVATVLLAMVAPNSAECICASQYCSGTNDCYCAQYMCPNGEMPPTSTFNVNTYQQPAPAPPPVVNSPQFGSGPPKYIKASHSGRCLDVAGVSKASGTTIHQWDCLGQANQQWALRFIANNGAGVPYYQVRPQHSNKCMDVEAVSKANSARVHQWDCIEGDQWNQKWIIRPSDNVAGAFNFVSVNSNKCLDIAGSGLPNGVAAIQYDCNGQGNQAFYITDV